jgi:uncharacterized membrane protein YfcA
MLDLMPLWALVAACAITLMAGFVKGAVGFAMPLIMVSGLGVFLEPQLAVAGLIMPALGSNAVQALRGGVPEVRSVLAEHWRYIAIVCVMILIVAQFLTRIPTQTMYLILGVPVVILSLVQLVGLRFRVPHGRRRLVEWGLGFLAGTLGGLTGTWGPPTVLYLIALDTPKARQFLVQGVVYGIGSVMLLVAHLNSGLLNAQTLPFSTLLMIPAFLGLWAGFALSDHLNPETFRRVTLIFMIVAGANLVRRGLFG